MNNQAQYIESSDCRFPVNLQTVKPKIKGLWARGNIGLVAGDKIVAIVGTRKMSRYGKQVLAEIVPRFIELGFTTISGFMYGIDVEMHRLTMENEGKTIGVFGWGIDAPIISENQNLYDKVLESGGLFLSELEPNSLGKLWTFPLRNRIVVGLADLVVVVEADIKSGSLNSAAWGAKLGKPVYSVPGSIFSEVSNGCNYLISMGLAKPFTLNYFKDKNYSEKVRINSTKHKINNDESILITQLKLEGPQSVNQLARALNTAANEVSARLTILLLIGEVKEDRGLWRVS